MRKILILICIVVISVLTLNGAEGDCSCFQDGRQLEQSELNPYADCWANQPGPDKFCGTSKECTFALFGGYLCTAKICVAPCYKNTY